ncbi:MAG: hypothetical protein D3903_03540 [Candidatus Electrothrix sp. GM3_4]|nr:hypothetical protein [Candidatus Electrothrix sp. GM3_4]
MQTWKFTIKPDSDNGFDSFLKCKELGLVGIGWSHGYEEQQPKNFDAAKELIKKEWGGSNIPYQINKLFHEIKPGDHLWMQKKGHYYLCIAGIKKYIAREICDDFRRYDLGHAIDAKWIEVPDELVCGSVQRGTIARRMIQRINLSEAEIKLNQYIENTLGSTPFCAPIIDNAALGNVLDAIKEETLFALMSPDDIEDIVASKLQTEGWVLIKSTCFRSKPQFEFSMINNSGVTGLVQVKSGKYPSPLNPFEYRGYLRGGNKIFLFTTHPVPYQGEPVEGIICFTRGEIIEWMKENSILLPPTVKLKLTI